MANPLPLLLIEQTLQRPLTSLERLVLESSWQGQRYRKMADESGYVEEYVKQVGARLWAELSEKTGSTVTKKNLHLVFDSLNKNSEFPQNAKAASSIPALSLDKSVAQSPLDKAPSLTEMQPPLQPSVSSFDYPSGPLPLASLYSTSLGRRIRFRRNDSPWLFTLH